MDMTSATPHRDDPESTSPRLRLTGGATALATRNDNEIGEATERLLVEARHLLVALKVDRSRVEARLAEFGRCDPILVVKGSSALDEAVESCQRVIEQLDRLAGASRHL